MVQCDETSALDDPDKAPITGLNADERLVRFLEAKATLEPGAYGGWARRLATALFAEFGGASGCFVDGVNSILKEAGYSPWLSDEMQAMVSCMRGYFEGDPQYDTLNCERIWHRARLAIFDAIAYRQMNEHMAVIRTNTILVRREFASKFSRENLVENITLELRTIGIQNALVAEFSDQQCEQLACTLALHNGEVVNIQDEKDNAQYPAVQLFPDFMHDDVRSSYVVFSLASEEERLGILALESGVADLYYEILREYISSMLKMIKVYENQTLLLKAEAAERHRAIELQHHQKLESLGVLAGGIAHDFNNMLSAMAGNLDVMFMDLAPEHPHYEPLNECRNVVTHATGLCRQLLAYSGKGTFVVQRTDLNDVLRDLESFL